MDKVLGDIELKRATLEDVDVILNIEKSIEGTKTYSALTTREEVAKEVANSYMFLIKEDGKTVGDISYELKDENHAYISGLAIRKEFQGRGIARKAVNMVLEQLKDVKLVDLVTHPENEKAVKLYASLGFKKEGQLLENYFGDGEPRIRMVLERKSTDR